MIRVAGVEWRWRAFWMIPVVFVLALARASTGEIKEMKETKRRKIPGIF